MAIISEKVPHRTTWEAVPLRELGGRRHMKRLSFLGAVFLALGWASARADEGSDTSTTVNTPGTTVKAPAGSKTKIDSTGATTTTAPGGSTTTIDTPDTPATTPPALPGDRTEAPPPPTTNVEINTPPPV